jgi:quercetin dioxygenase-like cupin family protein
MNCAYPLEKGFLMKKVLCIAVCLIFSSLASAQTGSLATADSSLGRFTLESCVNEFSLAKSETTKAGYQYWFVDKNFLDGRTVKMSVVAPHSATHPPHNHTEDEIFFVLDGKAEFYLNGKTKTAGPYTSFYCPTNSTHGIRNVGDSVLKYLVLKKYETR